MKNDGTVFTLENDNMKSVQQYIFTTDSMMQTSEKGDDL